MKITIIYDNETALPEAIPDWGFSCLIEFEGRRILFDTGADGKVLLHNMGVLGIDPQLVDWIFISHPHWDHTGGLSHVLSIKPVTVVVPWSMPPPLGASEVLRVDEPCEIESNIISSGELAGIEQSLFLKLSCGIFIITGCSHPGVPRIVQRAKSFGEVYGILGGFHGFSEFWCLKDLKLICPTHCTVYKEEILSTFKDRAVRGGVGRVIKIQEEL